MFHPSYVYIPELFQSFDHDWSLLVFLWTSCSKLPSLVFHEFFQDIYIRRCTWRSFMSFPMTAPSHLDLSMFLFQWPWPVPLSFPLTALFFFSIQCYTWRSFMSFPMTAPSHLDPLKPLLETTFVSALPPEKWDRHHSYCIKWLKLHSEIYHWSFFRFCI